MRIYLAIQMTGRKENELWKEFLEIKSIYERNGISVLNPLDGEGIGRSDRRLGDRCGQEADRIWREKDKALIRRAHCFVYVAPASFSQGVSAERAYARGVLWKPTLGVFMQGNPGFITRAEDDYTATSHQEAALVLRARWGSWWRRFKWRAVLLNRSLPRWILNQIKEIANV